MPNSITITEPPPLRVTAADLPAIAEQLREAITQRDDLIQSAAKRSLFIGVGLLRIEQCSERGTLAKLYKMLGKQASSAKSSLRLAQAFAAKAKGAQKLLASDEASDRATGQLRLGLGDEESPLQVALTEWVRGRSLRDMLRALSGDDDAQPELELGDSGESLAKAKGKSLPVSGGKRSDGADDLHKRELEQADAEAALETLTHYVSGGLYAAHNDESLKRARDLFAMAHEATSELLAKRLDAEPARKRKGK